jgi:hypothetical protein
MMAEFLVGPHLIDAILCLIAAEFALLQVARHRGFGPGGTDLMFNLVSGACLLLALRAALTGAAPAWILIFLTTALAAHIADLSRRWRR